MSDDGKVANAFSYAPSFRIHPIRDRYVNFYLIEEGNELNLVDTGTGSGLKKLERRLNDLRFDWSHLKRVLITHSDPDHVGSAAQIQKLSSAKLYAHPIEARALKEGKPSRPPKGAAFKALSKLIAPLTRMTPASVDERLVGGETVSILGGLEVIQTPGHTEGQLAFFAPQHRILFAGDALIATKKGLRFIQTNPFTWNPDAGQVSAKRLESLEPLEVYCGHGPTLKAEEVVFLLD